MTSLQNEGKDAYILFFCFLSLEFKPFDSRRRNEMNRWIESYSEKKKKRV